MRARTQQTGNDLIQESVKRIVSVVDPAEIILFGSRASGSSHEASDVDLLVIMESKLPRYKRAVPIYRALAGLFIPKDVLVYSREEVEAWRSVPQAFITSVVKHGRVLYAKKEKK